MGLKPAPVRAVSYFLYDHKKSKTYTASFDRTDKNEVSFETAKGLLLFLYSPNNNKTMCFSKINKINRVRSLPALSLSPLFKSNQITFIVTSPQHKCLGE